MQREITEPLDLLDPEGRLVDPGWGRHPNWNYNRDRIKSPWYRIKEWDYYAVISQDGGYGFSLTASDLGYAGLFAICWFDFNKGIYTQIDTVKSFSRGNTGLSLSPDGDSEFSFSDNKLSMTFSVSGGVRHIRFASPVFLGSDGEWGISGDITLTPVKGGESMNIATSWPRKPKKFYLNTKINNLSAEGEVSLGGVSHKFGTKGDYGVLDWGRGVWTYRNRWFWSSLSCAVDGHPFGWNLGYGFSDRTPATENMLFYKGKAHKLDQVSFNFKPDDYMHPWIITDNQGRLDVDFKPVFDRKSKMNFGLIKSEQHQVFGLFSGKAVLDNKKEISFSSVPGFAEDVYNRW